MAQGTLESDRPEVNPPQPPATWPLGCLLAVPGPEETRDRLGEEVSVQETAGACGVERVEGREPRGSPLSRKSKEPMDLRPRVGAHLYPSSSLSQDLLSNLGSITICASRVSDCVLTVPTTLWLRKHCELEEL